MNTPIPSDIELTRSRILLSYIVDISNKIKVLNYSTVSVITRSYNGYSKLVESVVHDVLYATEPVGRAETYRMIDMVTHIHDVDPVRLSCHVLSRLYIRLYIASNPDKAHSVTRLAELLPTLDDHLRGMVIATKYQAYTFTLHYTEILICALGEQK